MRLSFRHGAVSKQTEEQNIEEAPRKSYPDGSVGARDQERIWFKTCARSGTGQ